MAQIKTWRNDQANSTLDNDSYSYNWVQHSSKRFDAAWFDILFQTPEKLESIVVKGFGAENMAVMKWKEGMVERLTALRVLNISSKHFKSGGLIRSLFSAQSNVEELSMSYYHLDKVIKAFKKGQGM